MAQKQRSSLLERHSSAPSLPVSSSSGHVDHEEIVKLLEESPSRQDMLNTSTIRGADAPNRYNRRFSELDYENIPPVRSVMSESAEDLARSDYRRHFHDVQVDHFQTIQEVRHRVHNKPTTYHDVIFRTHSKRFSRRRQTWTNDKAHSDDKYLTERIPEEEEEEKPPVSKDTLKGGVENETDPNKKETEGMEQEQSQTDQRLLETDPDRKETEGMDQEQSQDSTAVKTGSDSKQQDPRSDLPYPDEKPENTQHPGNSSESQRKVSQLSSISMVSDEDVANLDQFAINQMLSHRYDDVPAVRKPTRTLHISRAPVIPKRTVKVSTSHKRHQENLICEETEQIDEEASQENAMPQTEEAMDQGLVGDNEITRQGEAKDGENIATVSVSSEGVKEDASLARSEEEANSLSWDVAHSSEEDSDDWGPPSKFAALGDADGQARYNKEKIKSLGSAKLEDEKLEGKAMKKVGEDEEKVPTEGTTDRKISKTFCESWNINSASSEEGSLDSDSHCRLKFSAIGSSNIDMVLAGQARYEEETKEMESRNRARTIANGEIFRSSGKSYNSPDTLPEMKSLSSNVLAPTSALAFGFADMALSFALTDKSKLEESLKPIEGSGGESPSRRVTFSQAEDQLQDSSEKSENIPKKRCKGISWDNDVDHSKMGQMMNEIGGLGDGPDSVPPEPSWTKKETVNVLKPRPLFVQLKELDRDDMGGQQRVILSKGASWKSKARWIKFEENFEEGANRWSKPHVASLTFHSLPQLRRTLENGLIMLDVMQTSLPSIFCHLVEGLVKMALIEPEQQGAILRMLQLHGTGNRNPSQPQQQWRSLHGRVSVMRRFTVFHDTAQLNSHDNNVTHNLSDDSKSPLTNGRDINCSNNSVHSVDDVCISMPENHGDISQNNNNSQIQPPTAHHHQGIMRKLPEDAEGAMVLVAMEDSLKSPVAALLRLVDAPVFDNFLDAPIPLRFIFFLVGPDYSNMDYHEVGRAMATLFSDDIFREMAYAAQDKDDLLNGINEFLNDTMVLPPGDWDKDLLLPITRHQKREQEKVMQRRMTLSPLQMEQDAAAILKKMQEDALNYADPLQRTGRIFGGLINDVKRRLPHYKSDFTDAFNFQCVAAFVFIYFACLSPAVTFGGLLGKKTDNYMGLTEMIMSTSLCGMLFALFSGQPLVILGGTGPVLIFEEYLYKFCKEIEIDFMAFRTWIGFWICILATVVVMFEGSVLVRYFTRFTEEIFSVLISIIFIYETFKGLKYIVCANPLLPSYCFDEVHVTVIENVLNGSEWTSSTTEYDDYHPPKTEDQHAAYKSDHGDPYQCSYDNTTHDDYGHKKDDHGCSPSKNPQPNTALFAIILTFGTFLIVFFLRIFRHSPFLGRTARRALSNFGIAIAILAMVTLTYLVGHIYTDTIHISQGFNPTDPCKRGWLINPMGQKKRLPLGAVFGAIAPAFLVFILLYMETLLIGMVVNKENNKLHKGSGYHLDLFLIGVLSALAGLMGVPWMCAAPIRTVSHIGSLTVLTRGQAPGVKPKLDHIKDQRLTNFAVSFLIGLSNLLAPLLSQVPIAVLLGVFLYLGITSLSGLQFIERLKICFMPQKHHPDVRYIRMVKLWKMHLYTVIQVFCVIVLWAIKHSIFAMAFPFFLILLIFIRKLLRFFFSREELEALDSEEEDEDDDRQVYDYDLG